MNPLSSRMIALSCAISCLAVAQANLISYWKFDETVGSVAADSNGLFPGNLTNAVSWAPAQGISGGAISVSLAGNGYVNMGSGFPTLTNSDYTLVTWIKTSTTVSCLIAGKHWSGFFNGYFNAIGSGAGYGSPNKAYVYNGGSPSQSPISTTTVNDGNWHQIVGVRRGSAAHIYVDGALQNSTSANFSSVTTAPFFVGGLIVSGSPTGAYDGLIDEVQVFDRALCSGQILYLYQNPGGDITSEVSVSGVITLQDYEGEVAGLTAVIHFVDCNDSVVDSESVVLAAGGSFVATTKVRGPFTVSAKVSHWLRGGDENVTISGSGASGVTISLVNGDAEDDNEVNLVDFGAVSSAFGSADGDPNWNADADLNGDGEVNLVDFGIVSANFGQAGGA